MSLPIFNTSVRELSMMQTAWAQSINPVLSQALLKGNTLNNVVLSVGDNVIDHKLGRPLQGWIVIRMQDGFTQLYDKQNSNQMKDKTLVLNSSGIGRVDLIVF
jgi:hypothetical protein